MTDNTAFPTYCEPAQRSNVCRLILAPADYIPPARRSSFLALAEWASVAARLAPAEPTDPERVACRGLLRALTAYATYCGRANLEVTLWTTCELWTARVRSFA